MSSESHPHARVTDSPAGQGRRPKAVTAATAEGEAPRENDAIRPRLVVADDSSTMRTYLRELLSPHFDVILCSNARDALAHCISHPPDVVISDITMPEMDGVELARRIKGDSTLRRIPVILLTGRGDKQDIAQSLNAGADDYLCKPFGQAELVARINVAVRSHEMYKELHAKHQELERTHARLAEAEADVRQSKASLEAIFTTAQSCILTTDAQGVILGINPAGEKMFGKSKEELIGTNLVNLVAHSDTPKDSPAEVELPRLLDWGEQGRKELVGNRPGADGFPVECSVTAIESQNERQYCFFLRDLTESRKMEIELRQAMKLEAVGRLASGIAHEINTPIQYVSDSAHFLQNSFGTLTSLLDFYRGKLQQTYAGQESSIEEMKQVEVDADWDYISDQIPKSLTRVLTGLARAAEIVRAMKTFSHPDQKSMSETDINDGLKVTLEIARNEYKYVADIETDFGELPPVTCHIGELNQVFLNIIVNGAHAIADAKKDSSERGVIRVKTAAMDDVVEIAISDTGCGIPEGLHDKIFEPFFTTKEVGRGTGQGLSIAKNIVEKHGGTVTFKSVVGQGTTFFIRLPRSQKQG